MREYTLLLKYNLGLNPRIKNPQNQPSLEISTQNSHYLSIIGLETTYCISFEELTTCLEDNYLVSYNHDTIAYIQENQAQNELQKDQFIRVKINTDTQEMVETQITLMQIEPASYKQSIFHFSLTFVQSLTNKRRVQRTELIHDYLIQPIIQSKDEYVLVSRQSVLNLISENKSLPLSVCQQNLRGYEEIQNRKESQIDILFLIGMSKNQTNQVSCEKEIQRVLERFRSKMEINISVVSTKDSFRQMLYSKPKIIHIICHGRKAESIDSKKEIKQAYLEIEDEQGGIYEFKGQKLIQMIEKCNCYPKLLILNACYSQEIYEDMLKVKSNKFCNTLIVNREFAINNTYAYQFISIFYENLLQQLLKKQQKINWDEGVIQPTKQEINKQQMKKQNKWKYLCCQKCKFQEYVKEQQQKMRSFDYFQEQQSIEYESYQSKTEQNEYQEYTKDISKEEFDFLKRFVVIHKYQLEKDGKCYKTSMFESGEIWFVQLLKNQHHIYYIMLCASFFSLGFKQNISLFKKQYPMKHLLDLIVNHKFSQNEQIIYKTLLIFVIKFFKYAHLQAERYIFKIQNDSKQLSLQPSTLRQSIIIENGPDFLTNPIPKMNIIHQNTKNTFLILKEHKINQPVQLNLNYYEQTKAIMLKHLTDLQVKNSSINPQIHIFNISNIKKGEENDKLKDDFYKIFLIDLPSVNSYLKSRNRSQINLFYLYGWHSEQEDLSQLKTKFLKENSTNIHLYIQNEKEQKFDYLIFDLISQEQSKQNQVIKNLGDSEDTKTLKYLIKNDCTYKDTFKLYDELLSSKVKDPNRENDEFQYIIQILNEKICEVQKNGKSKVWKYKKETIEEINTRLLSLINTQKYQQNMPLFKYLFKYVQMSHITFYKFIQYESLTRCLLKVILSYSPEQIEFQFNNNFNKFFDNDSNNNQNNIIQNNDTQNNNNQNNNQNNNTQNNLCTLTSIYSTFGLSYSPLNPNQKILVRAIILNKNIPLNNNLLDLIKSYLLFIEEEFSKNLYNNFRDLIKIHKRLLTDNSNSKMNIFDIEELLRYLKIKYYFRVAKHNPSYLNLYYITVLQNIKNINLLLNLKNNALLSIILQSRIIIKMIVFADNRQQHNEDILRILKIVRIFRKKIKNHIQKQVRDNNDPRNQLYSLLLHSSIVTEVIMILSKINEERSSLKKDSSETSERQNDNMMKKQLEQGIYKIKLYIAHIRTIYRDHKQYENTKQMNFYFSSYYKMELQLEQPLYKAFLIKPQVSIFDQLNDNYLSSEDILNHLSKLQEQGHQISDSIKKIISDSILSVQYYFNATKNSATNCHQNSQKIENLISQIHNRAIYDEKLLTHDNIKGSSFYKTLLKKLIIIDENVIEDDESLAQLYPVIEIKNGIIESNQTHNNESDSKVELLIILNTSDLLLHKKTFFNEKRVIYFNFNMFSKDKQQFKELQMKLLSHLLKNLIKPNSVHFSQQIFESIKQMEDQLLIEGENTEVLQSFFNCVQFKIHKNINIILDRLCISDKTQNPKENQQKSMSYKNEDFQDFFSQVLSQKYKPDFIDKFSTLIQIFGIRSLSQSSTSRSRSSSFPQTSRSSLNNNIQQQSTLNNSETNNQIVVQDGRDVSNQNFNFDNIVYQEIGLINEQNDNMNQQDTTLQNTLEKETNDQDDNDMFYNEYSSQQQKSQYECLQINR